MRRLIPLLAAVAALTIAAIVTVVAVGASSGGSDKSASRQTSGDESAHGVAAMCTADHPDCNDTALGGGGGVTCAPDAPCAQPVPVDPGTSCGSNGEGVKCVPSGPVDGGGGASTSGSGSSQPGTGGRGYDITVPFDASVTDDDTKLANEIVLAIDPNASFLLQESFPPTGRATVTTAMSDFCAAIESKLEGIPSIGDVTCVASANVNPPCCKPDAPVSSTPAGEPGVNPSEPGSSPSSGPTSE